jgi:hypothetical protein
LHNGSQRDQPERRPRRSFDVRDKRLFHQLDNEERKALTDLRQLFTAVRQGLERGEP